jgi:hypothetical protein
METSLVPVIVTVAMLVVVPMFVTMAVLVVMSMLVIMGVFVTVIMNVIVSVFMPVFVDVIVCVGIVFVTVIMNVRMAVAMLVTMLVLVIMLLVIMRMFVFMFVAHRLIVPSSRSTSASEHARIRKSLKSSISQVIPKSRFPSSLTPSCALTAASDVVRERIEGKCKVVGGRFSGRRIQFNPGITAWLSAIT